MRFNVAMETAGANCRGINGTVTQVLDEGLLVDRIIGEGLPDEEHSTILLKGVPQGKAVDDGIFVRAYPIGLFSYTTVNQSKNTIHAWTADLHYAVAYYLTNPISSR
jgi:hypothetical protein